MQFIGSFSTFNPLTGYFTCPYSELLKSKVKIPNLNGNKINFPSILDWITGRAQLIIKERNLEEIENALNTINYLFYLVEEENTPTIDSNDPIEIIAHSISSQLPIELFTPARMLNAQVPIFPIDDNESFRNGRWEQYFAILALALLGDIHRFFQFEKEMSITTVSLAAEAMEALVFAESPELIAPPMDPGLQEQSRRNRDNAITGHTAVNDWKRRFQTWLLEEYLPPLAGKSANKRHSAQIFKKRFMDPEIAANRAPELEEQKNLVRTLADSLANDPRFDNL